MKTKKQIPKELKAKLDEAIDMAISNYKKNGLDDDSNFSRNRVLTMKVMIKLLLAMQGGSLKKELHELGVPASASAFVQQRTKIPWTILEDVLENFNSFCEDKDREIYKGYRILAIDGTAVNMARNPKSDSFMQNESNLKGYNQLHVNPLYDVLNKSYIHCVIQPQPKQDEVGALTFMLSWHNFQEKTLIVADRGYESYNVFAHFLNNPMVDFLIRVKQDRSAMREIRKLPLMELDTEISCTITTTQTKLDKENNYILIQTRKNKNKVYSNKTRAGRWDFPSPYLLKFRVVRFMLETGEYETLATSLPSNFTLSEIKELYHARWGIETAFRELKYSIGISNLHGKKDSFVKQEVFAAMIMANFCSRIVKEVVLEQNSKNVHEYRVNMNMAIYLCKKYFRATKADEEQLMKDIAKYTEPVRPGRHDTRNIKAKTFAGFIYRVSA